jgi:hypothetical protein
MRAIFERAGGKAREISSEESHMNMNEGADLTMWHIFPLTALMQGLPDDEKGSRRRT